MLTRLARRVASFLLTRLTRRIMDGMNGYLTEYTKITNAITVAAGAAGSSDVNGATLDMQGWDGVLMIACFGPIVSGAATSVKAQQGAASDLSDAADLAGTGQTVADTDDNKIFAIDLFRPRERYVRLVAARATQNSTVTAVYIQYKGRSPFGSHASGVTVERHHRPAEGTA